MLINIASDARSTLDLANPVYDAGQARRRWLEKGDGLNSRPPRALLPLLRRGR